MDVFDFVSPLIRVLLLSSRDTKQIISTNLPAAPLMVARARIETEAGQQTKARQMESGLSCSLPSLRSSVLALSFPDLPGKMRGCAQCRGSGLHQADRQSEWRRGTQTTAAVRVLSAALTALPLRRRWLRTADPAASARSHGQREPVGTKRG